MGQIIEMDYQNRPQYLCRLYVRTGWPSIVTESVYSENYGAKFGQMNILTYENVTLYGEMITCLLVCDSVCSIRR